jgi:hypothetical protein
MSSEYPKGLRGLSVAIGENRQEGGRWLMRSNEKKNEKNEKNERNEKNEKNGKR